MSDALQGGSLTALPVIETQLVMFQHIFQQMYQLQMDKFSWKLTSFMRVTVQQFQLVYQ